MTAAGARAMKRAAIYARVSPSGSGSSEGTSLDSQIGAALLYARHHGYSVEPAHILSETYTGTRLDRPQLDQLWTLVRNHSVEAVIAYCMDRFSRSDPLDTLIVIRDLRNAGAQVLFVTEPMEDGPWGQLIALTRSIVASQERDKIIERTSRGKRARALKGKLVGANKALYGYFYDPATGTRSINAPEAAVVRQVYAWTVGGVSFRSITRRLNDEGVPPPSASAYGYQDGHQAVWHRTSVVRLLEDPAYHGEAYAYRWNAQRRAGGKTVVTRRDPSEWIALPQGNTPALVSEQDYRQAQAILALNQATARTRNLKRPFLLRGLIRCAVCGRSMQPVLDCKTPAYKCRSRYYPEGPCGSERVPAEQVEAEVWTSLAAFWAKPEVILAKSVERGPDTLIERQLLDLRARVAELERQQGRVLALFARGQEAGLPLEMIEKQLRSLEADKAAVQKRIGALEAKLEERADALFKLEMLVGHARAFGLRVTQRKTSWTFEEKRQVLLDHLVQVEASGPSWWLAGSLAGEAEPGVSARRGGRSLPNAGTGRFPFTLRRAA